MLLRLAAAAALLAAATPALADVSDLQAGLPAEVTDARPIGQGDKQVQVLTLWDRSRGGDDRLVLEPQAQWGFARDWQGTLGVRGIGGSADHTGSGDVRAELMRRFSAERAMLPSLAGFLAFALPSGRESRGIDTTLRLAATKTLGGAPYLQQVHGNVVWMRNAAASPEERGERWRLIAGYSRLLSQQTGLVADVIREQERARGEMASIAELGLRHELAHGTTLSFGAGVGRGSPSAPRWRLVAGFEQSF
jgi:hypothetical protein